MTNSNVLKINDASEVEASGLMAIIKGEKNNSLKIRKFVFLKPNNATLVPNRKYTYFKPPRLVLAKHRKYVEYYYRVPLDLPADLQAKHNPPGSWERFRVFENINRFKDPEFDRKLVQGVLDSLEEGKSPFQHEIDEYHRIKRKKEEEAKVKEQVITLNYATEKFLEGYKNEGTKGQYRTIVNFLKEYFTGETETVTDPWYQSVKYITDEDLLGFMQHYEEKRPWKPNTYNDKLEKIITIWEYLITKKYIKENPAKLLEKYSKGNIVKHEYYQDDFIPVVKEAMLKIGFWGPVLHQFCEVVYYSCTRTDQETRRLKVENIQWDLKQLYIPEDIAKGGRPRSIYMVAELEDLFLSMFLKNVPGHYYIFGKEGVPGPIPTDDGFFSDRFREDVREPNGFSDKFTIYGWKHTRIVHLYLAGVDIALLQQLCGHSSPSMTLKYLSRGLGIVLGSLRHEVSRKF